MGFDTLIVDDIELTGTYFHLAGSVNCPIRLGYNEISRLGIVFTPAVPGTVNETLSIYSNDPDNPIKTTSLIGIAQPTGLEPEPDKSTSQGSLYLNYPNPASDRVYFTNPEEIEEVRVYSLTGIELIKTTHIMAGIDVSELSAGTYLVKVIGNRQEKTRMLSVE